jgi:quinol-cytochrome oxidoreductase complex cytochrome b subunit
LLVFPFLVSDSSVRSTAFRPFFKIFFWFFLIDCFVLGWIGGKPIEYPYYTIGVVATLFYFGYLLVVIPFIHNLDKWIFYSNRIKA